MRSTDTREAPPQGQPSGVVGSEQGGEPTGEWDSLHVRRLLDWWSHRRRDYPWRYTTDPYLLGLSQILLVHAGPEWVATVWQDSVSRFHTAKSLAVASEREVVEALGPLRHEAGALIEFASRVVHYQGDVPTGERHPKRMMRAPKHGPRLVQLLVNGQRPLPVYSPVARVLRRLWGVELPGARIWRHLGVARAVATKGPVSRETFQALVDLAEAVCARKAPACHLCPLNACCRYATVYAYPYMGDRDDVSS